MKIARRNGSVHVPAGVAKLVTVADSKPAAARLVGSSPTSGTMARTNRTTLAYLIGVALGDGNLSNPNGRAVRLRISCCLDYPKVAKEIERSIHTLLPHNRISTVRKGTARCVDISVYSNVLAEWMPWRASAGSKIEQGAHVPEWIFERPTYMRACLRGLFQTDGCIYSDRGYQMVHFTNTIHELAHDAHRMLTELGFRPTISKIPNEARGKYVVRLARKTEVAKALRELALYKE